MKILLRKLITPDKIFSLAIMTHISSVQFSALSQFPKQNPVSDSGKTKCQPWHAQKIPSVRWADPRVYISSKNRVVMAIDILSTFHPHMGIAISGYLVKEWVIRQVQSSGFLTVWDTLLWASLGDSSSPFSPVPSTHLVLLVADRQSMVSIWVSFIFIGMLFFLSLLCSLNIQ